MFVYGRNSVEEALIEGVVLKTVWIEKGKEEKFENLERKLKEHGVEVKYDQDSVLCKLADTQKHQGIIAEMTLPPTVMEDASNFEDWVDFSTILALDGITDTGNLGAIIRSALLLGADAIVLPNDASARIAPQTIRSSAGALYKQKIFYVNNINTFIETVLAEGFGVYGLDGAGDHLITEINFPEKVCLVVGSEREGIRRSVKRKCTSMLKIPTTRKLDSFNASVAAALALWEVYRQKI